VSNSKHFIQSLYNNWPRNQNLSNWTIESSNDKKRLINICSNECSMISHNCFHETSHNNNLFQKKSNVQSFSTSINNNELHLIRLCFQFDQIDFNPFIQKKPHFQFHQNIFLFIYIFEYSDKKYYLFRIIDSWSPFMLYRLSYLFRCLWLSFENNCRFNSNSKIYLVNQRLCIFWKTHYKFISFITMILKSFSFKYRDFVSLLILKAIFSSD
jgi:hypothetical protein